MYLLDLKIDHLKLFSDFRLSFQEADGRPRPFTAIIGPNGCGKTSLLQAIALAAAGSRQVNNLARGVVGQLRDRRTTTAPLLIEARFGFSDLALKQGPEVLGLRPPGPDFALFSQVRQPADEPASLTASAEFRNGDAPLHVEADPLDRARAQRRHLWFVSAYGVARALPDAGQAPPKLDNPGIERMSSLFDGKMVSTTFANYFAEKYEGTGRENRYAALLKKALTTAEHLLPRIHDFELRGRGGVKTAGDLQERHRWSFRAGKAEVKLPAVALSHGYQSTIAWIADLIGYFLLEVEEENVPASEIRGLVLIDELDLYLHPLWQRFIVEALRVTFPKLQFIVTTHTPVLIASLRPEEIVRLDLDPETGDVVRIEQAEDPRLMTGTEILDRYFGLEDIHPSPVGQALYDYQLLAANPFRDEQDERRMETLKRQLDAAGVAVTYPVEARRGR